MADVFPVPTVLSGNDDPVAESGPNGLGLSGKLTDARMSRLIYHATGQILLLQDLANYRKYPVDNTPFRADVIQFLAGYEYSEDKEEWSLKKND